MAIPDQRRTFDHRRCVTPIEHLLDDHANRPDVPTDQHYREWALLVEGIAPDSISERSGQLQEQRHSIHFHTFTPLSVRALFDVLTERFVPGLEVLAEVQCDDEVIIVARAPGGNGADRRPPPLGGYEDADGTWPRQWPVEPNADPNIDPRALDPRRAMP